MILNLSDRMTRWIAALIILIHLGLLTVLIFRQYVVMDELFHIGAGVTHWQTGGFYAYHVNPPLSRLIATFPCYLLENKPDQLGYYGIPNERPEWKLGFEFFERNRSNFLFYLRLARFTNLIWAVLGGVLLFYWTHQWFGNFASLVCLSLWCFDPEILTLASVVIPDFPATVAGMLAHFWLYRYYHQPSYTKASLCGLGMGIALLTKSTWIFLWFIWPALWLLWKFYYKKNDLADSSQADLYPLSAQPSPGQIKFRHLGVVIFIGLFVLNLGYLFEDSFHRLGSYRFVSEMFSGKMDPAPNGELQNDDNRFAGTILAKIPIPVPKPFLCGIDLQKRDFESKFDSYLEGKWKKGGWIHYYAYALFIKMPLGVLLLMVFSWNYWLSIFVQRRDGSSALIGIPALILFCLISAQNGFSHHFRYVLPIYSFLYLLIGYWLKEVSLKDLLLKTSTSNSPQPNSTFSLFLKGLNGQIILTLVLLAWSITSSVMIFPYSHSYFNEIIGGPEHGGEYLLDSNIDWGQDYLDFEKWWQENAEEKGITSIGVKLFSPISISQLHQEFHEISNRPIPGWYAISVNFLHGNFRKSGNFHYFQNYQPVHRIGYTIYIYHLTKEEIEEIDEKSRKSDRQ